MGDIPHTIRNFGRVGIALSYRKNDFYLLYCNVQYIDAELLEYLVMYDFAPELCLFHNFFNCKAEFFVHSSSELIAFSEQAQNIHIF